MKATSLPPVPDLRQRRAPEDAPHLDLLAAVGDVVLPGDVLLHGLVLVLQTRARPRLDNLHTRGLVSAVQYSAVQYSTVQYSTPGTHGG